LGAALAGAILIALAAWAYQKSKSSSSGARAAGLITASVAVMLAIVLPVRFARVAAASASVSPGGAHAAGEWQPYDAAEVTRLNAAGRPLLVNFTASWCLTRLVNERNAFADSAVQAVFHAKGVTLMKGDWTNRDPVITQALAAFGRAGVPLYVVYNSKPGSTDPVVLPQLLTANIVQSVFADVSAPVRP
jgi:thiol:disulfide interchange protein DsbD